MSIQWIRDYYDVPAKRGMRVTYLPCEGSQDRKRTGVVTGTCGPHLRIRLDGDKRAGIYHPTWQIIYPAIPQNSEAGE